MTDLTNYLRPSLRSTLPPAILPRAKYPGIISADPIIINVGANLTPALRLQLAIDTRGPAKGWPPAVSERDKFQTGPNGEQFPIDLDMVRLRKDFFLTPAAYFRLENFLIAMGFTIEVDSEGNKNYEDAVNDLNGRTVDMEVEHMNSRNNELMNVVNDLYPRSTR